jgi:hypothetical protein
MPFLMFGGDWREQAKLNDNAVRTAEYVIRMNQICHRWKYSDSFYSNSSRFYYTNQVTSILNEDINNFAFNITKLKTNGQIP